MKQQLVKIVRRLLPLSLVRLAEEAYRRSRIFLVSFAFGFPAKSLRVIAVTGTNGKTTTVNYLNEILKAGGKKTAMFSTALIEVAGERRANELNMTVASTIEMQRFFQDAKRAKVDYVALEITSHSLHQHKLDGVPIEVAVMTNLTQDHLDYHKTMEAYAAAKGLLFARDPRFIVLNRDDAWYEFYAKYKAKDRSVTYGISDASTNRYAVSSTSEQGSDIHLSFDQKLECDVQAHLPGDYNAANIAAASTAAFLLDIPPDAVEQGVAGLKGIPGRFEHVVETPYDVIVDYAHTPDALEKLLITARPMTSGQVTLVFGACGDRDKAKRPIMGAIAARLADKVYLTDEESYNENPDMIRQMIRQGIEQAAGTTKMIEIADRRDAIKSALAAAKPGDRIFITGMGHEKYRIINGKRIPWNDADVVREILG